MIQRASLRHAVLVATFAGCLGAARSANAAGLNDPNCKPSAQRPFPAVVVHGQAGNFEGMKVVTDTLVGAGYCVYAKNYGFVPGGANGQDHLATSASQIQSQVDQVLKQTGAKKVDVIGHSAGTGVLDHYILKKGGDKTVHRMVSFGGLHHPYAHAGLAKANDGSLFLPNMIAFARKLVPNIGAQQVVKTALSLYASVGSPLGPVDPGLVATMESNFTDDLFDPTYWKDLHGSLSEADGNFVVVGGSERSRATKDSSPDVCYTNIVAAADFLAGAAAGFQDEATNVENVVDLTTLSQNAHVDMIANPANMTKMVASLDAPCAPGTKSPKPFAAHDDDPPTEDERAASADFQAALLGPSGHREAASYEPGCSFASERASGAPLLLSSSFAAGLVAALRRRSRRSKR